MPISAQLAKNIDYAAYYIAEFIPQPKKNLKQDPLMTIIRSFDINKPGTEFHALKGGVIGGSLLQGVLKVGDFVEIRPGRVVLDDHTGDKVCMPLFSQIKHLKSENNDLLYAVPGGLIGVGLDIDPSLTRSDGLKGNVRLGFTNLRLSASLASSQASTSVSRSNTRSSLIVSVTRRSTVLASSK